MLLLHRLSDGEIIERYSALRFFVLNCPKRELVTPEIEWEIQQLQVELIRRDYKELLSVSIYRQRPFDKEEDEKYFCNVDNEYIRRTELK